MHHCADPCDQLPVPRGLRSIRRSLGMAQRRLRVGPGQGTGLPSELRLGVLRRRRWWEAGVGLSGCLRVGGLGLWRGGLGGRCPRLHVHQADFEGVGLHGAHAIGPGGLTCVARVRRMSCSSAGRGEKGGRANTPHSPRSNSRSLATIPFPASTRASASAAAQGRPQRTKRREEPPPPTLTK